MNAPRDQRPAPETDGDDVPEALRQAWDRLPSPEPPDLVDQAVLNRAKAAVEKPHSSRPWSFGWPHALTTAAVIVLATSLFMPLRDSGPPPGAPERQEPSTPKELRSRAAEAPEEAGLQDAPAAAPMHSPAPANAEPEALEEARPQALSRTAAGADVQADQANRSGKAAPRTEAEARLQAIRDLLEAGERDAAREAALAFQREFPGTALPEDLAELLGLAVEESRP